MTEFLFGLLIGGWIGAFIGALALSLCYVARHSEKDYYA